MCFPLLVLRMEMRMMVLYRWMMSLGTCVIGDEWEEVEVRQMASMMLNRMQWNSFESRKLWLKDFG